MTVKRSRSDEASDYDYHQVDAIAANCLMLLSKVGKISSTIDSDGSGTLSKTTTTRKATSSESDSEAAGPSGRVFQCKTCNKRFHSFQALGGHRASHKKLRLVAELLTQPNSPPAKPKKHECPICGLEFPLGQALGGHMRRHRAELLEGKREIVDVQKMAPLQSVLKRSNSSKRVFGLDLNLTPYENDLKEGTKIQSTTAAPLLLHCFI